MVSAAKAFSKEPPKKPLTSLKRIVKDFKWRYVERKKTDQVIAYCKSAPTLKIAVSRAVLSRDADGKHHNHQSKVDINARIELGRMIWKRRKEWLNWIHVARENPTDDWMGLGPFDAFHDWINENKPYGIGPVTVYDVAVRISAFLDIKPTTVYMHAGVRQGMKALEEALERTEPMESPHEAAVLIQGSHRLPRVPMYLFPAPLCDMLADDVEDILCTYREVFESW